MNAIEKFSERYFSRVEKMTDKDWASWLQSREKNREERLARLQFQSLYFSTSIALKSFEVMDFHTLVNDATAYFGMTEEYRPPTHYKNEPEEQEIDEIAGCLTSDFYFC